MVSRVLAQTIDFSKHLSHLSRLQEEGVGLGVMSDVHTVRYARVSLWGDRFEKKYSSQLGLLNVAN
jgi:hypothetical protein